MDQAISTAVVLAPFVFALVQVMKTYVITDRAAPIAALVLGIVFAVVVAFAGVVAEVSFDKPGYVILVGIVSGLIASGAYSGVKAVARGP